MKNQNKQTEPQLVQNPVTGRWVNMQPLWQIGQEVFDNSPAIMAQTIDNSIRLLNKSMVEDDEGYIADMKQNLFNLYELRDMFNNMTEYNESKRKEA